MKTIRLQPIDPITPKVSGSCIVESPDRTKIIVIRRKYPPLGLALPGGMQELWEETAECAVREVKEETGVDISEVVGVLNITSKPSYDPRWHLVVVNLVAKTDKEQEAIAGDDAGGAFWMDYNSDELIDQFIESVKATIYDYRQWRNNGSPPLAVAR